MEYTKLIDRIVLPQTDYFCATDTLTCGQTFRFRPTEKGYAVFSAGYFAEIEQGKEIVIRTDAPDYFQNYFDLDADYRVINESVRVNDVMQKAAEFGKGIRILRQDLYETILSFLLSSNNRIERIQSILERLCIGAGEKTAFGYAFPTPERLRRQQDSFFDSLRAGYRAEYLKRTVAMLDDAFLKVLPTLPTPQAREKLQMLSGVGPKVADCILLFGLHRTEVFPVDTWIEKCYRLYFDQGHPFRQISPYFCDLFGKYAGFAQQYLFYFQREL